MNSEESPDLADSDLARRSRAASLRHQRQALQELRKQPAVLEMLSDFRRQREYVEQLIFETEIDFKTLLSREQLIGQRNGLSTAEAWLDGRLIEIDAEIAQLEKSHVPDSQ